MPWDLLAGLGLLGLQSVLTGLLFGWLLTGKDEAKTTNDDGPVPLER